MIFWHNELAGTWYPVEATVALKDVDGVVLNVGDQVIIKATVQNLIALTTYTGEAILHLSFGPDVTLNLSTLNLIKS